MEPSFYNKKVCGIVEGSFMSFRLHALKPPLAVFFGITASSWDSQQQPAIWLIIARWDSAVCKRKLRCMSLLHFSKAFLQSTGYHYALTNSGAGLIQRQFGHRPRFAAK